MAELRARFPAILRTEVPYGSDFERMAARRAPIESYAPASAAAETYRSLWREIDERLTSLSSARAAKSGPSAPPLPTVGLPEIATDSDLVGSPWSGGPA